MKEGFLDFTEIATPGRTRMDELRVGVGPLWGLRQTFPTCVDDLLDVAMAVYVADRLVKRDRGGGSWQPRALHITIPVADPDLWEALKPLLNDLLRWLTLDAWHLDFVAEVTRQRNRPAYALPLGHPDRPFVALYSGGLDSLAGAVAQSLDPAYNAAVLVGAQSGKRLKKLQTEQRAALGKRLSHLHWEDVRGFSHPYKKGRLENWNVPEQRQEKSQRSRGFLFLVFGAVTAYAYHADALHIYENGIGAINLPYTSAFGGADMTRAMHPKTLLLAGHLFSSLFGQPFRVVNASLWRTKGEMCAQLAAVGLSDLANATKSCDSFPLREAHDQCGLCTSCLLRRISLHAAGLSDADQGTALYRDDIYTMGTDSQSKMLRPYYFMLRQARTLKKVTLSDDILDFRQTFDELDEARYALGELTGMAPAQVDSALLGLYRRYTSEVLAFHDTVTSSDHPKGNRYDEELQRA